MVPSPATQQPAEFPARPNRDGLGYAVAALMMDLFAMAIIITTIWYLSDIDYRPTPPQLDFLGFNPLQGLLIFFLLFAPFFLAGWGRIWGLQARTLAIISAPSVQRLARLSAIFALIDVIAGLLPFVLSIYLSVSNR